MSVLVLGMQLPEKCCKCSVLRKNLGICALAGKHVFDTAAKPDWCPMIEVEAADANVLRKTWANEPEVLESIDKAVIA